MIEKIKTEVVPENIMDAETRTLHEALDDFATNLKVTSVYNHTHKRIDRVKYLKDM